MNNKGKKGKDNEVLQGSVSDDAAFEEQSAHLRELGRITAERILEFVAEGEEPSQIDPVVRELVTKLYERITGIYEDRSGTWCDACHCTTAYPNPTAVIHYQGCELADLYAIVTGKPAQTKAVTGRVRPTHSLR